MAATRSQPYPQTKPLCLNLWVATKTAVHPAKPDQENADACMATTRYLGVFDGVGGVRQRGMIPAAMSNGLAVSVGGELERRLSVNAQRFDRDTQLFLKSSVRANTAGVCDVC